MDHLALNILRHISTLINQKTTPLYQQHALTMSYFIDEHYYFQPRNDNPDCPLDFQCVIHNKRVQSNGSGDIWQRGRLSMNNKERTACIDPYKNIPGDFSTKEFYIIGSSLCLYYSLSL